MFAAALLASGAALAVPAVFFDGVVSSGQSNFTNVVTTANPTATIFSYDFALASTGSFMVSSGGTDVYVDVSRNGSASSFSSGFDNWSVNVSGSGSGGWQEIISEGFRLDFYADAARTTQYMVNAVGISVYDWGTCCTASNNTPAGSTAPGSAIYAVFDPDATQSTTQIGNITNSAARADTDNDDTHFVAAIDDSNTFSSVVIAPNGSGEAFGAGGTLMFSVVGIGSVAPGSSVITVGAPPIPDINTAQAFYTTADLIAAAVNPVFDGGTLTASANGTISNNLSVKASGGTIDANGHDVTYSGVISDNNGATGSMTFTGGGTTTLSGSNTYSGSTSIDSGATLTLSGSLASTTINIASGATLNDNSGGLSASTDVTANGAFNLGANEAINTLNGSGTVGLNANTLTVNQGSFSGDIGGSGGIVIAGGSLTLSSNNTYTGATNINNSATLALSGSGSIAASSGVTANGTFDISGTTSGATVTTLAGSGNVALGSQNLTLSNAADTFSGNIVGNGGLIVAGGTETLSGSNSFTGSTVIHGGATLALSGNGSIASSNGLTNNGNFDIAATTAGASIASLAGSGTVTLGGQNLTLTNAADIFSGAIAGTGAVVVAGGTQTLSGVNTYTGGTTVSGGATLRVDADTNLGAGTGSLNLANGTLQNTASFTMSRDISLTTSGIFNTDTGTILTDTTGNVSGIGALVKDGAGTLILGGVLSHVGDTTVNAGTLVLSGFNTTTGAASISSGATLALTGAGSIAATSGVTNNGTLDISGTSAGASITTLSGNGNVALGNQTLSLTNAADTFAGSIGGTGGLTVTGGSETLTGIQTFTGQTNIAGGATLALAGNGSIAASSGLIADGAFDISATTSGASLSTLSGSGSLNLGTQALTLTNAAGNFAGNIAGSGSLAVSGGTQTLSGISTYTGGTTISGGATVVISADANLGDASGHLTLDNGTLQSTASLSMTRDITLVGNGTFNTDSGTTLSNSSGAIGGTGALIKNGDGTLALGGTLSHNGGSIVNAGTLTLSGNNTYTGGTTLNGGTLQVSTDNNLGAASSNLTMNGGTLQTTASMASARNISVSSGGGSFNTDTSTTLTLNGSISGSGNLTKAGTGTLILAGDNSGAPNHTSGTGWTGDLLINAGLVQVTNPWGLGWGNVTVNGGTINTTVDILTGQSIALAGGTKVTTDTGTTTTLSGDITTAASSSGGCFVKDGLGTLNITGSATLSNGTCVQQGMLRANGTLNSDVTVDSGATLSGAGVINGTVNVQGTLSPGNSPGFLTATSTVTMLSGSTLQEDIAGTTQASSSSPIGATGYYSYLHVTNGGQFVIAANSTLAPMLKNIFSASESGYGSPSFVPSIGQMYRIVTADGGVSGRFSTLAQPDGLADNTRFAAFYNTFGSNSIDLAVLPTSYAAFLSGGNANVRSAAGALDRILTADQSGSGTAAQDQLLYVTAGKTAAELPGYVKGLAGEIHGAVAAVVPQSGQWLQGSVARQLNGASTTGGVANEPKDLTAGSALWVDIGSNHSHWKADDYAAGFSTQRTQFAIGGDLLFNGQNRLGLGFSHASTNVSADVGSGSIDENMGFAYGQYAVSGLLIDGLAGYGTSSTNTQRVDPTGLSGTLNSKQQNHNSLVSAGIRAPWQLGETVIEPFARVMWQKTTRDAFDEGNGVAALSFASYSASGVRTMLGVAGNSVKSDPLAAPMTFRFTLGLGQDSGSLVRPSVNASLTGVDTTIVAPHVSRTFAQANLSGTFRLNQDTYTYVGLTGEARSGKSDIGVNAGVRMSF